jgi:hypothetical protein
MFDWRWPFQARQRWLRMPRATLSRQRSTWPAGSSVFSIDSASRTQAAAMCINMARERLSLATAASRVQSAAWSRNNFALDFTTPRSADLAAPRLRDGRTVADADFQNRELVFGRVWPEGNV